jgi:glycosyltransferase involved in cell wall biosynthesis
VEVVDRAATSMRILELCTEFGGGGIARHVLDLSESLREMGHQITCAGSAGVLLDKNIDPGFFPLPMVSVSDAGGGVPSRIINAFRCARLLRTRFHREPVDLIHCHESAPALVARLATLGMRIPILLTYHGSEPGRVRQFGAIGRRCAQTVITPSRHCAEDLHHRGGVPRDRLRVIGLGIYPAPEADSSLVSQTRSELLGMDGKTLVVVVARATYQKGLDILVDVVARVLQSRNDVRFVIAGDGPLLDSIRVLAREKKVDGHMHFVGHIASPYTLLYAADLFLLTSRWEALPISIVEAMRAGLPVVAADVGGVRELVDSTTGAVVPMGDVDGFADDVLRIAADDHLRAQMSGAAFKRGQEDRFSPAFVHKEFERLYQSTLERAR